MQDTNWLQVWASPEVSEVQWWPCWQCNNRDPLFTGSVREETHMSTGSKDFKNDLFKNKNSCYRSCWSSVKRRLLGKRSSAAKDKNQCRIFEKNSFELNNTAIHVDSIIEVGPLVMLIYCPCKYPGRYKSENSPTSVSSQWPTSAAVYHRSISLRFNSNSNEISDG